ncbi:MAG TPA: hypothetical protein ENH65_11035 [Candidatus Aminicenantes bacterium]|nr:hypothetical protein [Candidatus Aminicenantes bacterium]
MTRYCTCDQWEKGIKAVSGPIHLQSLRSGGQYQFDQDYIFLFCPWCGVRLVSPCRHCGSPSNEKTGNTLYWEDEKNFCSPECVMEDYVKEGRN